jgi:hypothetical protein
MIGNNAHTSAGGGGQSDGRPANGPKRKPLLAPATGKVEGHGKRSGTSGDVVQTTSGVRDTTSENGIMGK